MSKEMREQIDRVKNWKQFLNEQQTTTPKVLTLNSQQLSQLVMNTNYSVKSLMCLFKNSKKKR